MTDLAKSVFKSSIEILSVTQTESQLQFNLRVTNTGDAPWIGASEDFMLLGARVFDCDSDQFVLEKHRKIPLKIVQPSESLELIFTLNLTELSEGDFRVELDMLVQGSAWFSELGGQSKSFVFSHYTELS